MGLIDSLEARASKGGQWFLRNPDAFALQLWGGTDTASGLNVDAERALEWPALASALRILAHTLASLPLNVYRRLERGKEPDRAHPLYRILHHSPNPEQTALEFRALIPIHAILWGNFYAEIVRANGQVAALWPLNPDRVRLTRSATGAVQYEIWGEDNRRRILRADQVFHLPGFSSGGLVGRGLAHDHQEAIGLGIATELYTARFFGNNAAPGGVLRHPETLSEEAQRRLKASFEAAHGGLSQAFRLLVLEEGLEWQQTTTDPEKAQALGLRQFNVNEAVRIVTGVPPHLIGDLSRSTFSNIEHQSLEFVQYGLQPWLVKIEQRIWMQLLTDAERAAGLFAEHIIEGILRGDSASRASFYQQMFSLGSLSPNEIREKENLNPVEDGDTYFVKSDHMAIDRALNPPAPPPPFGAEPEEEGGEEEERAAPPETRVARRPITRSFEPLFREVMQRVTGREVNRVRRALDHLKAGDEAAFREFLRSYYFERFPAEIKTLVHSLFQAYADEIGRAAAYESGGEYDEGRTRAFVDGYTDSFANRHSGSSRVQLENLLAEPDDSLTAVQQRLELWESGTEDTAARADQMAHRESRQLANAVAVATFAAAGVAYLVSRAIGDSCPYCEALDGVVIGIEENFLLEGQVFQPEGADRPLVAGRSMRHPPYHGGCDCIVEPQG